MKTVLKYYLRVTTFLFPFLFIPWIVEAYGAGRMWLSMSLATIGLVLWIVRLVVDKKDTVKFNGTMLWGLGLLLWATYSWWKLPAGVKPDSFLNPVGYGGLLSMMVWFFVWVQVADEEEEKKQLNFLTAAGMVIAVLTLVVFLVPQKKLPIAIPNKDNVLLSIGQGWSVTGALLSEVILLAFLAVCWIKRVATALKEKKDYIVDTIISGFLFLGLAVSAYKLVKFGWVSLDGSSGWVIAVETFKRRPWDGMGIGNYAQAFNIFRPVSYNMTKYWTGIFGVANSGLLQLWTELGAVGLVLTGGMVLSLFKQRKKSFNFWILVCLALATVFVPVNSMILWLLAWLTAFGVAENRKTKLGWNAGEQGVNVVPMILGGVIVVLSALGGYKWVRVLLGEIALRNSLVAAAKNNGGETYNLQIKAIGYNQDAANYRKLYSQTNLALAMTLLNNENASEDDKQKASVLIQQAVREAKAAIALDNLNAGYWTNLASIYKSMIGLVDGAADWSFQAYQQAVALDPSNPLIKLDMGGLLFAAGKYEEADRVFEQVVANKQDFANGWYNWAYTAKKMNKLGDAVSRLTQAVALVPADSGDYEKATKELNDWKKELEDAIKKQQDLVKQQQASQEKKPETLKTPEPLPTGTEEKVNVPLEDLQPPTVEEEQPQATPAPQQ